MYAVFHFYWSVHSISNKWAHAVHHTPSLLAYARIDTFTAAEVMLNCVDSAILVEQGGDCFLAENCAAVLLYHYRAAALTNSVDFDS